MPSCLFLQISLPARQQQQWCMGETAISSASSSQHASTHRQPARPLCLLRRKPPRQHRQGARGAEYRKAEDDERNYQRNHEWIPSHPRPSMLHLRISPGRASINESLGAQLPLPAVSQAGGRRPASLREGRVPDRTRLACDALAHTCRPLQQSRVPNRRPLPNAALLDLQTSRGQSVFAAGTRAARSEALRRRQAHVAAPPLPPHRHRSSRAASTRRDDRARRGTDMPIFHWPWYVKMPPIARLAP